MRNCKGCVMEGLETLQGMKRLQELHIDGNVFQKMKADGVRLKHVQTLVVHDCSTFSSLDYQHLANFISLNRLILTNVSSSWK